MSGRTRNESIDNAAIEAAITELADACDADRFGAYPRISIHIRVAVDRKQAIVEFEVASAHRDGKVRKGNGPSLARSMRSWRRSLAKGGRA